MKYQRYLSYPNFFDLAYKLSSKEINISPNDYIYSEAAYIDKNDGLEQLIFLSKDLKYVYLFNEIYDSNDEVAVDFMDKFKIDVVVYDESSDFENELHLHCGDQVFDFYNIDDLFDLELREKLFTSVQGTQKAA
ncbi:MAG: hypothetical protein K2X69_13215 [Silvanigrellaceae bacterium]|nr:hypothetical protein [Silvanigrellaceae bacterium]